MSTSPTCPTCGNPTKTGESPRTRLRLSLVSSEGHHQNELRIGDDGSSELLELKLELVLLEFDVVGLEGRHCEPEGGSRVIVERIGARGYVSLVEGVALDRLCQWGGRRRVSEELTATVRAYGLPGTVVVFELLVEGEIR